MILKQSTAYTRMLLMIDSTDHVTGKTGLTVTVTLSKAGGAFAAAGGTITEVSSGWYKIALTTTDTNTLGELAFHCTGTAADPTDFVDTVSARINDDMAYPATTGRSMVVDASGLVDANAVKIGPTGSGTSQTARDIGASVLLSTGTGTGQLDFTSGVVKANLAQILGTALTETAGQIAAAFKQFFNIASPTSTMNVITTVTTTTTATTATNLTNAPTAGDFTAAMKTSLNAATPTVTAGTVSDKTGYSLSGTFTTLDSTFLRTNTATGGAAGSITLDASASATDSLYNGAWVFVKSGTGLGQSRLITGYTGSTKVATITPNWTTNPDNTSVFAIFPAAYIAGVNGNVSGSVASVSGNVTGSVGSVVGAVASVTGNVNGNVVGSVGSVTGAVGSVTGAVGSVTGNVGGSVASVTTVSAGAITAASLAADTITAAKVASDVTDEIWAKACTEPTAVVAASPTAIAALSWLLTLSRNTITQTSTTQILKADDTTTTVASSTVSDDGTTFTRGEFA